MFIQHQVTAMALGNFQRHAQTEPGALAGILYGIEAYFLSSLYIAISPSRFGSSCIARLPR